MDVGDGRAGTPGGPRIRAVGASHKPASGIRIREVRGKESSASGGAPRSACPPARRRDRFAPKPRPRPTSAPSVLRRATCHKNNKTPARSPAVASRSGGTPLGPTSRRGRPGRCSGELRRRRSGLEPMAHSAAFGESRSGSSSTFNERCPPLGPVKVPEYHPPRMSRAPGCEPAPTYTAEQLSSCRHRVSPPFISPPGFRRSPTHTPAARYRSRYAPAQTRSCSTGVRVVVDR